MGRFCVFRSIPVLATWISEEERCRGFGRKLISHLEHVAKEEGCVQVGLGVGLYRDYGSAQKLYWSLGYRPDGEGITYKCSFVVPGKEYPVDDDLVFWMVKPL
jgi:GNAT superfamily N-acetyltransferase